MLNGITKSANPNSDNCSSIRVVMLLSIVTVLSIWVWANVIMFGHKEYDGKLVEIPPSVAALLALITSGKVVQAFAERWPSGALDPPTGEPAVPAPAGLPTEPVR